MSIALALVSTAVLAGFAGSLLTPSSVRAELAPAPVATSLSRVERALEALTQRIERLAGLLEMERAPRALEAPMRLAASSDAPWSAGGDLERIAELLERFEQVEGRMGAQLEERGARLLDYRPPLANRQAATNWPALEALFHDPEAAEAAALERFSLATLSEVLEQLGRPTAASNSNGQMQVVYELGERVLAFYFLDGHVIRLDIDY